MNWQNDPDQEIAGWISMWDQNWDHIDCPEGTECREVEEGCYDLYDLAKDARVYMEELSHNLEIKEHMVLAILQDLCPTFNGKELSSLYKIYFQRITNYLKTGELDRD